MLFTVEITLMSSVLMILTLEKEIDNHSVLLAWLIPRTLNKPRIDD